MPESKARALWFVEPRRVEVRDEPLAELGPRDVLVRGLASAVSQGTEMLLYRGEGPTVFDPSLGETSPHGTYPCRYGYAWVGEVVEGASFAIGERVFAFAPHATMHSLHIDQTRLIDEDIPATRAVLAANMETAITCVWDAEPSLGESAVVLGGGVVGILTAWLLERSGARVTLVERSERRRTAARALLGERAEVIAAAHPKGDDDLVVEATGDPMNLDVAMAYCASEARVIVASFYGSRRSAVDFGDRFHRKRLTVRSSQVSLIPPRMAGRGWDRERRWLLVGSLLREPGLDALVAEPVPFERAAELYARLDREDDLPPAHVFRYR